MEPNELVLSPPEPLPPRAQVLAELLVQTLNLVGYGKVEIEINEDGEVKSIWRHDRTLAKGLGRFDHEPSTEGGA